MKKFNGVMGMIKEKTSANAPEILIGMGLAGMLSSTIFAVRATPKALRILEEEQHRNKDYELTNWDKVKLTYKNYIPAAVGYSLSAACIISARNITSKKNIALMSACSISERVLSDYREKVVESIGVDKEREIRDSVSKRTIERNPIENSNVIFTGSGDTTCYDPISGRYFKCSIEKIKSAVNNLNFTMLNDMYVSVNDLYDLIGLSDTASGDIMGWNVNDGQLEIHFSAQLTEDGQPCLVMDPVIFPKQGFNIL